MTTYAFNLVLQETEMIVVQAALDHYIKHCEDEIDAGKVDRDAPASLYLMREVALEVRSRLHSNPE